MHDARFDTTGAAHAILSFDATCRPCMGVRVAHIQRQCTCMYVQHQRLRVGVITHTGTVHVGKVTVKLENGLREHARAA